MKVSALRPPSPESAGGTPILRPSHNCWRCARTDRVGMLIDGHDYYTALHEALCRARRSIYIIGWDIDSRLELVRDPDGDMPTRLAPLLSHLAESNPVLDVRILAWEFSTIFLLERELLPRLRFGRGTHENVHFRLDGAHAAGASHHQKLVVIDDCLAFCGGLDLCDVRWDTREHRVGDERRVSRSGRPYRPHHDVQMMVDGEAAVALGELARLRWARCTGDVLEPPRVDSDPWPSRVDPLMRDVDVGIARTLPAAPGKRQIREVEQLWIDSIHTARDTIYIENGYVTSRRIGQVLAESLRRTRGPEIVMVVPQLSTGWLQGATMGVLRDRILAQLRAEDRHHRLLVVSPFAPGSDENDPWTAINVHAKICIVDDRLLRVGSANLSNRSMGLDTECDLAVEADGRVDIRAKIRAIREDLLAEHLRVPHLQVREAIENTGSVVAAVQQLAEGTRTLRSCRPTSSPAVDRVLPDARLIDPDRPLARREIMRLLMHDTGRSKWQYIAWAWWGLLAVTLLVANVADWLSASDLLEMLAGFAGSGLLTVLAVAIAFTVGGLLLVPVTLLIANSGLVFGPWWGILFALVGAFVSAAVYYWMGRAVGHDVVDRLAGRRLRDASRAVARRGLLAVAAVRLVPVAPHAVVGLVAGTTRIGFADYMLGTVAGMAPGTIVLVMVGHGLAMGLRGTSPAAWLPVAGIVVVGLVVAWLLQRWLGQGAALHEEKGEDGGA